MRNELVCEDILFLKCNDSHLWLKINKTFFDFENDVYICLSYIPPANSSRQGIIESSIYDDILENILLIKNTNNEACNFVILGDLNSRIGQQRDYVADDYATHMNILPDDYIPDQEIPRKSQDNVVNSNGQLLLEFLK